MNKDLERLQKRIANSGYTSRRKAETLITEGKSKSQWSSSYRTWNES